MDALTLVTGATVAVATFLAALSLQTNLGSTRRMVQRRTLGHGETSETPSQMLLAIPRLEALTERRRRLTLDIERAGLALTVTEFMLVRTGLAILLAVAGLWITSLVSLGSPWSIMVAILCFLIGTALPGMYLKRRFARRLYLLEEQLLDALVSMAKSIKAGVALIQALEYAANDAPEPLGPELLRVVGELRLGAEIEIVLEQMNERVGSSDLEITSTAIIIQRRVGGNLSEILNNVAETMRERKAIRSELHSVTAKQRLQGNLSALLPVLVALAFFAINPNMASVLIEKTAGQIALGVGIFFELAGLWMVRKFAEIEV